MRLSVANGAVRTSRTLTFRYTVIDAPISYFWNFFIPYTVVGNLSADKLRASWHVTLTCQGAGCPVKRATLKIRRGTASATGVLNGAHLRVGTIVQIIVSAPNAVAEVVRFQIVSDRLPRTTSLCQTPGQRAPGACHHP